MRLTCPECAAQYEIADGLIPPQGREVECSACGHGWHQPGEATLVLTADAAVDDDLPPDGLPPPSARAPDDPVFTILREEAERELSARADERARRDPLAAGIADATRRPPQAGALPDPHALAASLQWEVPERRADPEAAALPPAPPAAVAAPAGARQPPPLPRRGVTATELRQRRAHDRGFGFGILLAAVLAAAYLAAPSLADRGAAGARLMQARAAADEGRFWLQGQAEALADSAASGVRGLID